MTPQFGQIYDIYSGKRQHICLTNCVTRTEQVSIYLRYLSGGLTKETFIGYSLRPSKTGTAIVHYYFFSLAGPRDKQVVFAIRAKLGLTPQMDVRPYAYGSQTVRIAPVPNVWKLVGLLCSFSIWAISTFRCGLQMQSMCGLINEVYSSRNTSSFM